MKTSLAYDKAVSFRWHDQDGRLHVDRSNLTRVQVAPYRGAEIPGCEELHLSPTKIYYGFRPPEELGDEETVKSVIGIPIQLNHHLDYPDAPAMDTRVGSTGDQARFDGTFLSNSLHFQNESACRRIRDGSMKELSLAYSYDPDFNSPGVYNGQHYDFTMRNIRGQHLALVEEGRAGPSCVVEDHALEEINSMDMDDKVPPIGANDGDEEPVEKAEVKIADAMGMLAELLRGLHKTNAQGETVAITEDMDKDAKIREIAAMFAKLGADEEDVKKLTDSLSDLAYSPDENQTAEDEDEDEVVEKEKVEEETPDGTETDEFEDIARDAIKACGYDNESEEFQRAFAEGVKYGERKEKQEPQKLDREHEREGEERYLHGAQDAKMLSRRIAALENASLIRTALDECSTVIGKARATAFDSADAVYIAALKQLGVSTAGMSRKNAREKFLGVVQGMSLAAKRREVAADSAKSLKVADIAKGIRVNVS